MRYLEYIALFACLAVLVGMGTGCAPADITATGSGGTTGPGTGTPTPSNIVVSLAPTSIAAGGTTTVTATVTDAFSNPMAGVTVNFGMSAAVGSFSAVTATDAAGVATATFTANPAINTVVSITATVLLAGGGSINNSASLIIGTPTSTPSNLTVTISPLTVNIMAQATVTVTAVTSTGTPAYNTDIDIDITSGATLGSFSSTIDDDSVTLTTDSSGQVTVTFYAGGTSGNVTITATSVVAPTVTRSASLTVTSDPASVTLNASSTNITTSGTTTLTASVANILGSDVPDGTTVTFAITAGNTSAGTFSSTTATTVLGDASVTFTASPSITGSIVITATAGPASGTVLITISAANTGSIEFVSANPQVIGIVGSGVQSTSVVTFLVKDTLGNPKSGVAVDFTLYGPFGSTLQNASGSTGTNGQVTTILQAGSVAGPARVVASVPSTSIVTSSGNISVGGGVPSAKWFDLSAGRVNLEGLACNNVTTEITAFLADRFGNYNILQGTSVSFATEAGAIDTSNVTDASGVTKVILRTQAPIPTDVIPSGLEPNYAYGGRTYNPRDGYVTVLASTTGEENFTDTNGDGVYTLGTDTFSLTADDLGEPYIDNDDSATRGVGELFFDWPSYVPPETGNAVNPNGVYDDPNGVWDSRIPIWKKYTFVFTGPPHVANTAISPRILTSRIENGNATPNEYSNVTIVPGASRTFYVYVSDINMNALISGTTITVSTTSGQLDVSPANPLALTDSSSGATRLTAILTNNISGSVSVSPLLRAQIAWPGSCGSTTTYVYYPGSITFTPPSPPAAPSGVIATAGAVGQINISWNAVTGASSYNVYWGTAAGATTNVITGVTSPYVHPGRTTGVTYYYAVTAVGAGGESAKSSEVSAVAP